MALGGLTNGVTVEDMAAAYSVFANGGIYTKPYSYTKVLDSSNRVLLENDVESERVISEATAFIITDMLHGVVNGASGTGRLAKMSDVAVYGKTGTTNNDYDKWFVGYTKYYVGAVWFGFDTPSSIRNAGIRENISARLWKKVMENVHEDYMVGEILPGDNLVSAHICNITGELATTFCESSMQYFEKGTEPKVYCSGTHYNIDMIIPENPTEIPGEITDGTQLPSDSQAQTGGYEVGDFIPSEGYTEEDYIPEPEQNNSGEGQTIIPTLNESGSDDVITLE